MNSPLRLCTILACALTLAAVSPSRAEVLLGNLPSNDGDFASFNAGYVRGVAFTTGSRTLNVESVTLRLRMYISSADNLQLGIYQENGAGTNVSGGPVGGLFNTPASASNSAGNFIFTPTNRVLLLPNTRYWLLMRLVSGGMEWTTSVPSVMATGTGAVVGQYKTSVDNGAIFANSSFISSFAIEGTEDIVAMYIRQGLEALAFYAGIGQVQLGYSAYYDKLSLAFYIFYSRDGDQANALFNLYSYKGKSLKHLHLSKKKPKIGRYFEFLNLALAHKQYWTIKGNPKRGRTLYLKYLTIARAARA